MLIYILLAVLFHHSYPVFNGLISVAIKKCSIGSPRKCELTLSRHCQAAEEVKPENRFQQDPASLGTSLGISNPNLFFFLDFGNIL